ncbi:calcium-binding protein [Nocardioides sp. SYSU D00038]|uniref:calcium-binding protein n=1 Tax=Nocardioides sp. SYSU D00038 TaxID=2812554 RepID=UPI001967BC09|nr:calcium-binding protein [Nocardioides sp. SYSU D00038]
MNRRLIATVLVAVTLPLLGTVTDQAAAAKPRCEGRKATIVGTAKGEVIRGTPKRDVIVAKGGNDRILGRGGDDLICADGGHDTVDGGPGNDAVVAGAGNDRVEGASGADRLSGATGNDRIDGGPGNDRLDGGSQTDKVYGGSGNDVVLTGTGNRDVAFGGAGDDTVTVAATGGFADGEAGDDSLVTTAAATHLAGGTDDDSLTGSRHADRLDGHAGDDLIEAGDGADTCTGGAGHDLCDGGRPGGPENTPDDPDVCDATVEERQSCRSGLPDAYVGTLHGYEINAQASDEGTWSMRVRFERDVTIGEDTYYDLAAGSVDWSLTGDNGDCTWSQKATVVPLDPGSGYLVLDDADHTYEVNMGYADPLPDSVWHCDGRTSEHAEPWRPGNTVLGNPWDPARPTLAADLVVPDSDGSPDTIAWDLTPVYE